MAATDLNTVRSTIEARLATELASSPVIPVVFNNMTFDSTAEDTFVQCVTSFGNNSYLTQGGTTDSDNQIDGLVLLNVFTEEGLGAGSNFTICKRLRDYTIELQYQVLFLMHLLALRFLPQVQKVSFKLKLE